MKVQMRTFVAGFIIPPLAVLVAACGGKESVASKSAAAYTEAQAKGVQVGGGHGGHSPAAGEQSTSAGMDHSKMNSGDMAAMDHSKMSSGDMAGMDHSKMSSGAMAGMDHSKMSGMSHGGAVSSGGLWGALPGSLAGGADAPDQAAMAGMNHPPSEPALSPSHPSGHEGHSSATPTPSASAAITSTQLTGLQPQQTLREDNLDRPAPISVAETLKSSGSGHDMGSMSGSPAAAPEPGTSNADQVSYTCPLHPEVVSSKPGKCPKCGKNLVQKEKK